ncbi:MAG: InlB B-repeat-containing protein, partial [Corallococcus sp.]|nr:InlB B-repeat-containing protein [Corallococcus sp.]
MKRKTLAIVLSVLLVVSAVLVLTACAQEYTITFRDAGIKKDEQTTVQGKVEYKGAAMTADDRIFDGWYDAATGGNKVDLATTTFTENTTLYAHWTFIGESKGYCLPGIINGEQNNADEKDLWDTKNAAEEPSRKLTHTSATSNVYTIDLMLKASDSFKLITAYGESNSWNKGKIQVGGRETTVVLAEGVTLPTGKDIDDLFDLSNSDNNINVMVGMTATLKFTYNGNSDDSTIEITVKSITGEFLAAPNEVGFFVAGAFNDFYDKGTVASTDATNGKYVMTADSAKNLFTIEGLKIKQGQDFKVKINETGWRTQYGYSAFTFQFASDVTETTTRPDGKTAADVFAQGTNDDSNKNVVVKYNITVDMELDYAANIVTVTITEIDWTEQKSDAELGYFVVCTPNGYYNAATVEKTDATNGKYVMSVDDAKDTVYAVEGIQLSANQTFRVKLNTSGWACSQYRYTDAKFEKADGVTLPEGITLATLFVDEGGNDHNIIVKGANVTLSLTLDTSKESEQLTVTVTAIEAVAAEKPITEIGCLIVGDHNGWTLYNAEGVTANVLTYDSTNEVYKITGVQIGQDKDFCIKVNDNDNWARGQFGHGCLRNVTFDESVTKLPSTIERTNAIATLTGNSSEKGNIKALYAMTISVTLDFAAKKIDIVITEIATTRDEAAPTDGFSIAGSINSWGEETPKIAMTANGDRTVFTKEGLELTKGAAFQIKNGELNNWNPQFGSDAVKSVTAPGVTLPAEKTANDLFDLSASDIKANYALTVTV